MLRCELRRKGGWDGGFLTHDWVRYFERDIECIRTFFRRRFNYESKLYPKFARDTEREFSLDVQVAASGFTKKHQKEFEELTAAFGINDTNEDDREETSGDEESSDNDSSEEEDDEDEQEDGDDDEDNVEKDGSEAEPELEGHAGRKSGPADDAEIALPIEALKITEDVEDGEHADSDSEASELEANVNTQKLPYRDDLAKPDHRMDPNNIRQRLAKGFIGQRTKEGRRNHTKARHRGQVAKQKIKDTGNDIF